MVLGVYGGVSVGRMIKSYVEVEVLTSVGEGVKVSEGMGVRVYVGGRNGVLDGVGVVLIVGV